MNKLDLTKTFKQYYTATGIPELVTIEKGLFVTISGKGDPNGAAFGEVTAALYAVAYGIKFSSKQKGRDFTVSKLEGFWWVDDNSVDPLQVPRDQWHYELAIRMPDEVTRQQFSEAVLSAEKKKKSVYIRAVDFKHIEEGLCIQLLHTGPFSEEPGSLKKMEDFMQQRGLQMNGRHHEIYLSDYRKTAPEKLKTILRHPVR
ncbi:GyrI-like domain-containing protein [Chitinophaga sp. 22321]|uniref:GyrI-like domain-containing protein n=1 Tax=Chitinophaga hostae TaxID=2831022 RepID=A0ABS5ITJ6_9BACT|nr:GyrI-like domain-containing protein [Chitinophaga hostae]MBS0026287.1 GyrI-like domain-containing protein [Chitinophaga hostae]